MAIYHCSIKTVSRSAGRSATASAAYRASENTPKKEELNILKLYFLKLFLKI